jgi:DNA repair exonuclease SbcCD ATPase subunit
VAWFLAVVGAASLLVFVALAVGLARRMSQLARSMTALQKELVPALEEIQAISEETRNLTSRLEERARALRPDGD